MDPFSLTVGITSLVALTAQTLNLTKKYFHGVKNASKSAAELSAQLHFLRSILSRLDELLRGDDAKGQSFNDDSVLVSSVSACKTRLHMLHGKLNAVGESLMGRLKWPLNEKEHQESIQELKTLSTWIQFAITIDGRSMLSKTSEDVMEVLRKQMESLRSLKDLNTRTALIEHSANEQNQIWQEDRKAQEREKILNWISRFESENKHTAISMPRVDGTGEWLLNREEFQRWCDGVEPSNILCCQGIQGSGKSVLASLVIDRLRDDHFDQNSAIGFVYFDYRDQDSQSAENVVASLLKQITINKPQLPRSVLELYTKCKEQVQQPQLQDLETTLWNVCLDFTKVFIIMDALDECNETRHRKHALAFLARLGQRSNIRLFVTSRPYPQDIQRVFSGAPQIMIEADTQDLRRFLYKRIEDSGNADIIDETFKEELIENIAKGAKKMFLLPALQIQTIVNEPTAGDMEDALKAMPRDLQKAFHHTLERIRAQSEGRKRLGLDTLMWVSHAKGSLTTAELSEALAIRRGKTSLDSRYRPSQKMMVDCCQGLVTIDQDTSTIRLVHYAIQEFFEDQQEQIFPHGHDKIAESCLTYLLFDAFSHGCCETDVAIEDRMETYPLIRYAANHWGFHLQQSQDDTTYKLALELLHSKSRRAMAVQILQFSQNYREEYWEPDEVNSQTILHMACHFGLLKIACDILDAKEADVDAATHIGTTALIRAAASGHVELVEMLLSKNADPLKPNWYGTALHCAAEAGQCETIKPLLDTGMDVDTRDDFGRTPLHCAAQTNRLPAVKLLLSRGADLHARDKSELMLIHFAAQHGDEELIQQLLVEKKVDFTATGNTGETVLHCAASAGHINVVCMLLDEGAAVDIEDEMGHTPLHFAAAWGREKLVPLLVSRGADVNAKAKNDATPIYLAASNGNLGIVQILIGLGTKWGVFEYLEPDASSASVDGADGTKYKPRARQRRRRNA